MDFIRAITKALYVEFPINLMNVLFDVNEGSEIQIKKANFLKAMLRDILRHTQSSFTTSNINSLLEIAFNKWLYGDDKSKWENVQIENRLILLPMIVGEKLISSATPNPTVKFDQLLRWRDLTFHTSEDLLTIPAIANYDYKHNISDRQFLWEDTLPHDADWLNKLLNKGICDLHAHLASSADPAMLNWIVLMNHPHKALNFESPYRQAEKDTDTFLSQNYDPITPNTLNETLPLSKWIIIAAWIRSEIFSRIIGRKKPNKEWMLDLSSLKEADLKNALTQIYNDIRTLNKNKTVEFATLDTFNGLHWDYAVNDKSTGSLSIEDQKSPYLIHFGERKLIYDFYRRYLLKDKHFIKMAKYVWLYLLIRNKFRREVLNTNTLTGFNNFKKYFLSRDIGYTASGNPIPTDDETLMNQCNEIQLKYAIQTSIGKDNIHGLEARIGKGALDNLQDLAYEKSIFFKHKLFNREDCKLTLVVQFSKNEDHQSKELSRQIRDYKSLSEELISSHSIYRRQTPPFVGVDACSNEMAARPYVFGRHYRLLSQNTIKNQTFHVGEDFHDMIDGLRAIDEAINHLHYDNNLRFGHALALGLDIKRYYQRRHFCAVLPRHVLLDNVVWVKHKAIQLSLVVPSHIKEWIEQVFNDQLNVIGYTESITDIDSGIYWDSVRFRGMDKDEPLPDGIASDFLALDPKAEYLLHLFMDDAEIAKKGAEAVEATIPKDIVDLLVEIQISLRKEVQARGITVECNPTSNLVIGPFERYSEHPMFIMNRPMFSDDNSDINITICTDNKGIMATSIENEYSLIAAAMSKPDPYNPLFKPSTQDNIIAYLKKIQENSWNFRFS